MAKRRSKRAGSGNRKIVVTVMALALLAAIVLGTGVGSNSSAGDGAATTTTIPRSAGPAPEIEPLAAYKVTYLTESLAAGEQIFTTETYSVKRPFEGITYEYKGKPEKKIFVNERRQSFGLLGNEGASHTPYATGVPPGTPSGDMRLDSVLEELARRGAVVTGKAKTVDGRPCTIIKTKDPIFGAKAEPPNDQDHTDNCIDRHGIVLEERWWLSKKLTRIRTAVELDLSPTFTDDEFDFKVKPFPIDQGGSLLQKLDKLPEDHTTVDVPAGFESKGLYRFYLGRPPQGDSPQLPLVRSVQVWQRDTDFIVLEQGQSGFGYDLPSTTSPVDVPTLVDTGLNISTSGAEVFGHDGFSQVWLLRSSLSPSRLVAVAKTIHK